MWWAGSGRSAGAEWWDDEDFTDYGLELAQVDDLRALALSWADDLATRLPAYPPTRLPAAEDPEYSEH